MSELKFRLAFIPALEAGAEVFNKEAETYKQARLMLDAIAECILFMHAKNYMTDFSNASWVEVFVDGEWEEAEEDEEDEYEAEAI